MRAAGYGGPIWRIPHPSWPDETVEPARLSGDPLVGCFGHLNINKRIPALLEAFAALRERRPGARLLLVGEATERFELDRRLERLGLGGDELIREQWVSEQRFRSLMAACDVLVNLRSPTMGETSGSVIRGLALGKPMLVSDVGWFAELPDDVALKIPVDDYEVPTIAGALELAADHGAELGSAASAYVHEAHDLGRAADAYAAALEEAAGGEAVTDAVLLRIAEGGRRNRLRRSRRAGPARPRGRAGMSTVTAVRSRALAIPAWVWLTGIVVVSIAVRVALGRRMVAPWIMIDEVVYSELAKNVAAHGEFLVRGVPSHGYGFVYPVLIAPAWALFTSIPSAYAAAKAINAVAMSLAAIPAYFLARRILPRAPRPARRRAHGARPGDALHGRDHDRERLLPDLPPHRARPRHHAREADRLCGRSGCSRCACSRSRRERRRSRSSRQSRRRPIVLGLVERRGLRGTFRPFAWLYGLLGAGALARAGRDRRSRPLAAHAPRRLPRRDLRELHAEGRPPLLPLPRRRSRPRARDPPLCRAPRHVARASPPDSGRACLHGRVARRLRSGCSPRCRRSPRRATSTGSRSATSSTSLRSALIALLGLAADGIVPRARRPIVAAAVVAGVLPFFIPYARFIGPSALSDTFSLLPWWWAQDHLIHLRRR